MGAVVLDFQGQAMGWLNPGRWLAILAACAALALSYVVWSRHQQGIGYAKAQAEYTASALAAEKSARTREAELQTKITKATQDAKSRETKLQAAAVASRSAADSLRLDIEAIRRSLPDDTASAAAERASAAGQLLGECAGAYSELAQKADRHANDALMLQAAWPK